jgi:hypothetical protein
MAATTYESELQELAPRQFAVVYDPGGPFDMPVAGYGMQFRNGTAVFVWSGPDGGGYGMGQFGSADRVVAVVGVMYPARLVWLSPAAEGL